MIRNYNRQTGKSTKIAKRLKNNENIIVIQPTLQQAKYFIHYHELTPEQSKRIFTMHELMYTKYKYLLHKNAKIIFDELSACLQAGFGNWESYGTEVIL